MQVVVSDEVNQTIVPTQKEFDQAWAELGADIKLQMLTFNANITWLNLYMSHDGRPAFVRTIQRVI